MHLHCSICGPAQWILAAVAASTVALIGYELRWRTSDYFAKYVTEMRLIGEPEFVCKPRQRRRGLMSQLFQSCGNSFIEYELVGCHTFRLRKRLAKISWAQMQKICEIANSQIGSDIFLNISANEFILLPRQTSARTPAGVCTIRSVTYIAR
jgi:hypothetical protein